MMGVVENTYPPASLYNRIPFIHDMGHVAETHADDLYYLRSLLDKHDMPPSVCIKLLHIHFHLKPGEILVMHELDAPPLIHGKIPFLEPMAPDTAPGKVYGCNYIVDDASGSLQAFEYTTIAGGADLTAHPAFVAEFCAAVLQREVQHMFGLAINSGAAQHGSWMELDFPEKRATFLLQAHVSLPRSDRLVLRTTVTKFPCLRNDKNKKRDTHIHVEHTWGSSKPTGFDGEEPVDGVTTKNGLHLTGIPLEPGTAFYTVASAISVAVMG